ncbi:hypothetical protein EU538_11340 [Candidatus Thorarchaeota archaeon]|nr:MAG: hypothetical protein EU538_11340 [Candidatus Thorarchaeota archaeon]
MAKKRKKEDTVQMTLDASDGKNDKMQSKLTDLPGVGEKTVESLIQAGFDSPEKIAKSSANTLAKKVDGVGRATAGKIIAAAKKMTEPVKKKPTKKKATKKEVKRSRSKKKPERSEKAGKSDAPMTKLPGVGKKTRDSLIAAGYDSVEKISRSKAAKIAKDVEGVGKATAERIVEAAKNLTKPPKKKSKSEKKRKPKETLPKTASAEIAMTELPGVGKKTRQSLIAAGYDSVEKISRSKPSTIAKKVDGVGKKTAEDIVKASKSLTKPPKKKPMPKKKTKSEEPEPKAGSAEIAMTELPSVGKKTRDSLIAAGYDSVEKISQSNPAKIAKDVDGVGKKTAEDIVKAAKTLVPREEESLAIPMKELPGVGPKTKDALVDAGFSSVVQISESKPGEIAKAVDGVGRATAKKIVAAAQELVKSGQESVEEPKLTMRPVRPMKKVPERERAKPVKKKSGLPVPDTVVDLEKEMKKNWAEAQKKIDEREVQKTMKVSALTANETEDRLVREVQMVLNEIVTTGRPAFEIPSRSSDNIVWDEVRDLLLLGMKKISRPYHSLGSVVDATRTARLMEIVFQLLQANLHATKREVFYSDVNLFRDQKYSDRIIEDVASMLQTTRDSIHIVASARGSAMGRVLIRDGGDLIDLTKMGTGGWAITPFLDQVDIIESDAEFIIMSEKDAAVMRLAEAKYWNRQPCIVLTGKGSGDIATRAFLKRLVRELEIPAFALVDSDPYGHYIYSVFLRGSKRLSYESPFIATPELKLLGVLSRDLDEYNIPKAVRIPMEQTDMKRVKDMLKEDFVQSNKEWVEDLRLMLKLKEKAEIQAFASHSFEFLTDEYLPTKLETGDWI